GFWDLGTTRRSQSKGQVHSWGQANYHSGPEACRLLRGRGALTSCGPYQSHSPQIDEDRYCSCRKALETSLVVHLLLCCYRNVTSNSIAGVQSLTQQETNTQVRQGFQ